jgi:hypothetical protein
MKNSSGQPKQRLQKCDYKTKTIYWNIKTKLMSSTQCKDTKSYEHVNEHTTGRNILTENYHTQQENADYNLYENFHITCSTYILFIITGFSIYEKWNILYFYVL